MSDKKATTKETLIELRDQLTSAREVARAAVEDGEFHMNPVYTAVKAAVDAVERRIFQVEDSERELAAVEAQRKAEQDRAAAAEKAKAERAEFERKAIAKADEERKAEQARQAEYEAQRSGEARRRYERKDEDELAVLCDKRNVARKPGATKADLVNLLLQSDGHKLSKPAAKTPDAAQAPVPEGAKPQEPIATKPLE